MTNRPRAIKDLMGAGLIPVVAAALVGGASVEIGRLNPSTLLLIAAVAAAALLLFLWVRKLQLAVLLLFTAAIPLPIEVTVAGLVISIKDLILVLVIAALLAERPLLRVQQTPAVVAVYALAAVMAMLGLLSSVAALHQDLAIRQLLSWVAIAALAFLFARTLQGIEVAGQAFLLLIVVTDLVCLDTLTQLASQGQFAPLAALFQREDRFQYVVGGLNRPLSAFGSANVLAGFLAIVAPLCLYLATHATGRAVRFFSLGSLVVIVMATLATLSRGGIIAEVGSLTCYVLIQSRSHRRTRIRLAIVALAALIIASGLAVGALDTVIARLAIFTPTTLSDPVGRPAYWSLVLSLLPGHEVLGLGLDNLRLENPFLIGGLTADNATAHNLWLQILMETGVLGLIIFCLLSVRLVTLLLGPASSPQLMVRDLARVLLSCWFGVAAVGVTEYLATSQLQNLYALLAAFTLALPTLALSVQKTKTTQGASAAALESIRAGSTTVVGSERGRLGAVQGLAAPDRASSY